MPRVATDRLRRLRLRAQLLDRPGRHSPSDVVRHLVGIQAQQRPAAALAIRARTTGVTARDVDQALWEERSLVWTWAMRGTLHLIPAEDHAWLVPLTGESQIAGARRRLAQEGVAWPKAERAVGLIEEMLAGEGPLTRPEIAARLRRHRIRTEGQAAAHLVRLPALRGITCYGPSKDDEPAFVMVRDWLGPQRTLDRDGAMAELATRYLGGHGPAEPTDFAAWSGLRAADVRGAWSLIADRLVEVDTADGTMWTLRSARSAGAARGLVRLIPAFDPYLLGWRTRDLVLPREHEREVFPGGGLLRPAVLADGTAVGTWSCTVRAGRVVVTVRPFSKLAPTVRGEVEKEADDVARFHGMPGELAIEEPAVRADRSGEGRNHRGKEEHDRGVSGHRVGDHGGSGPVPGRLAGPEHPG